jgi:hypothetical protein
MRRAKAVCASYGITVEAVMTDNGGAYRTTIHGTDCGRHALAASGPIYSEQGVTPTAERVNATSAGSIGPPSTIVKSRSSEKR